MPNTSQPSQRPTHGNSSGFEVAPGAEFVLFEKPGLAETQTSLETFTYPNTEPVTPRVVQGGLPLARFGGENVVPLEVFTARRAEEVSRVIRELRADAVHVVASEQGLRSVA